MLSFPLRRSALGGRVRIRAMALYYYLETRHKPFILMYGKQPHCLTIPCESRPREADEVLQGTGHPAFRVRGNRLARASAWALLPLALAVEAAGLLTGGTISGGSRP